MVLDVPKTGTGKPKTNSERLTQVVGKMIKNVNIMSHITQTRQIGKYLVQEVIRV